MSGVVQQDIQLVTGMGDLSDFGVEVLDAQLVIGHRRHLIDNRTQGAHQALNPL
jgi:hypothetical protein